MHKEIELFLKGNMKGNSVPFSIRIPPELHEFMVQKTQKEGIEVPVFVRTSIALALLPEMLESYLKAEMRQWISQSCENGLELHLKRKGEKLATITNLAKYATSEINGFLKKMLEAECECLNKINDKIYEETKNFKDLEELKTKTITVERTVRSKK